MNLVINIYFNYSFFTRKSKIFVDAFNNIHEHSSSIDLFENYVYGVPAYSTTGTDIHYSNTNYSLLGMIIENASEMPLGEFVENNIITPLEFTNTFYKNSAEYPDVPNLVNSYFEQFENNLSYCSDIQKHLADIAMGHEGMIATPLDFLIFMENLIQGNIINEALTREMVDISDDPDNSEYRLGIVRYETALGYGYGHTVGAVGTMSFPEAQVSFSMACNQSLVFGGSNVSLFYDDLF